MKQAVHRLSMAFLAVLVVLAASCTPTSPPEVAVTEPSSGQAASPLPPDPAQPPQPTSTPEPVTPSPASPEAVTTQELPDLPFIPAGAVITVENAGELRELARVEMPAPWAIQYLPGMDRLALNWAGQMVLYDPLDAAGTESRPLPEAGSLPWMHPGFFLSPDGSLVAWLRGECPAEAMRCQILVQPLGRGDSLLELETDVLSAIAFSDDNRFLVVGGSEGLAVYSLEGGEQVAVLPESLYFDRIAISPGGSLLAGFTYMSEFINVWRLPGGELAYRLQPEAYTGVFFPNHVAFSPDGQTLAAGANGLIGLWQAADGSELRFWQPHNVEISALAFSPDGKLLVSSDWDRNLAISDAAAGKVLQTYQGQPGVIWRAGFAAQGSVLFTAGDDGLLRLWGVSEEENN